MWRMFLVLMLQIYQYHRVIQDHQSMDFVRVMLYLYFDYLVDFFPTMITIHLLNHKNN